MSSKNKKYQFRLTMIIIAYIIIYAASELLNASSGFMLYLTYALMGICLVLGAYNAYKYFKTNKKKSDANE